MPEDTELEPLAPVVDEDGDDTAELLDMVQDVNGRKMVGLDQLIKHRKADKGNKKEIAALRAQVEEYKGIDERLQRVLPIAEAVERDPALAKEIKAALDGTRASRPASVEQVVDDPEAVEMAQSLGLVTKDTAGNDVWDVARAKRVLDIGTARAEKRMKPQLDRATNEAYGIRGEQNLAALYQMQTPSGELQATDESIKEILKESQMPVSTLADPRVARTVGLMAAGLDREKGRTPKAPIEPMYFERAGGRRGESTPVLTDDDRRIARRVGLTDQQLTDSLKLKPNRKGEIDLE